MATTITNGTLKVNITEHCILNGKNQGASNTFNISSINEISKRIVTCPASEITVLSFGTANAAGTFIEGDVRYVRITNKDNSNFVTLNIEGDGSTDFSIRLDPGASYLIVSTSSTGVVDYADISGVTLEDLTAIKAIPNTAACDVEIFVASI
jgi:hypothetical protein